MTCVIAHRDGWMAADCRTVFQDLLIGPYLTRKIKRARGLLVASSGDGVFGDLIQDALDAAAAGDTFGAAVRVFRDMGRNIGGHALALTADGITEITSSGAICRLTSDWWAIGSGYQFALGYLQGASQSRGIVTPEMATEAIGFAATRVNNVGDGVQIERL